MRSDDERTDRQSADLSRHLHAAHPVLFLAHRAGGRATVSSAQLTGVDESSLDVAVVTADGPQQLHSTFSGTVGDSRQRVFHKPKGLRGWPPCAVGTRPG